MLTVAIPTYNRGAILVKTLASLFELIPHPAAIIIADQTLSHPADVEALLQKWADEGAIIWHRLSEPSIPHAMNVALQLAATPLVLFLDDDILPEMELFVAHEAAHEDTSVWAVAGQVLQPGQVQEPQRGGDDDLEFAFNSAKPHWIRNVMAGNLSVKRNHAIHIGGFDENFVGAAYRFETDFARRVTTAGGRILFQPAAAIRHLQLTTGGLRSFGNHMTASSPLHSAGDYYFALLHRTDFWRYAVRRLVRNVATRYHAARPWRIPSKLVGELRGLLLAHRLFRRGRRLMHGSAEGARK